MKVVWINDARNDLENIYSFVAQYNERTAAKIYNNILDRVCKLGDLPQLGVIEPLLSNDLSVYRSLIIRRAYKAVYRTDEKYVYIIAIWDCRQKPSKLRNLLKRNK